MVEFVGWSERRPRRGGRSLNGSVPSITVATPRWIPLLLPRLSPERWLMHPPLRAGGEVVVKKEWNELAPLARWVWLICLILPLLGRRRARMYSVRVILVVLHSNQLDRRLLLEVPGALEAILGGVQGQRDRAELWIGDLGNV